MDYWALLVSASEQFLLDERLRHAVRASTLSQRLLARTSGIPGPALIKFLRGERFRLVNAERALVLASGDLLLVALEATSGKMMPFDSRARLQILEG